MSGFCAYGFGFLCGSGSTTTSAAAAVATTSSIIRSSTLSSSILVAPSPSTILSSSSLIVASSSVTVPSSSTKASSSVAAVASASAAALKLSSEAAYSNCYYTIDDGSKFNTRWVADWTTGVAQDLTGIVSSAYTVGQVTTTTTTAPAKRAKKSKRALNNFFSMLANALSFRITPQSGPKPIALPPASTSSASTAAVASPAASGASSSASGATTEAVVASVAALSSSTQIYTSYNDIMYGSVRAVILLSSATGFTSFRSDMMEIDINWLNSHSSYDTSVVADAASAWHEYRVDWLPGATNYYIDGKLVDTSASETRPGFWLWNAWSDGTADSVFQMRSIDAYFNRTSVNADIGNGVAVCKQVTVNGAASSAGSAASSIVSSASSVVSSASSVVSSATAAVVGTASSVVSTATSAVGSVAGTATSAVGSVAGTATSAVGSVAGTATSAVGSVAGTATSAVGSVAGTATSAVGGAASGAAGVVGNALSASSVVASSTPAPTTLATSTITPTLSAQATVSFTTITSAWTGQSISTSTRLNGLAATVIVLTPGVVQTTASSTSSSGGYVYMTMTTDLGTFSTVQTKTIFPKIGTTATVQIIYPTPPTTCSNDGIAYAGYTNYFAGGQATLGYPLFTPTVYKTAKPTQTGVTNYIAEVNGANANVAYYGRVSTQSQNWVLDHTFYLFARQDGYYSFNIPYTDDIQLVWYGDKAISGWTRDNANIVQFWSQSIAAQTPQTIAVYLTTGSYLPLRVMWGNGGNAGELDFNIYGPDGSVIMASNKGLGTGTSSVDIVQFPCDATLGRKFPAWGFET